MNWIPKNIFCRSRNWFLPNNWKDVAIYVWVLRISRSQTWQLSVEMPSKFIGQKSTKFLELNAHFKVGPQAVCQKSGEIAEQTRRRKSISSYRNTCAVLSPSFISISKSTFETKIDCVIKHPTAVEELASASYFFWSSKHFLPIQEEKRYLRFPATHVTLCVLNTPWILILKSSIAKKFLINFLGIIALKCERDAPVLSSRPLPQVLSCDNSRTCWQPQNYTELLQLRPRAEQLKTSVLFNFQKSGAFFIRN